MHLLHSPAQIKVSTTLDKSSSKKNLIDGSPETCWSSTQGTPQTIQVTFDNPSLVHSISLTFQGGFAGLRAAIHIKSSSDATESTADSWAFSERIFPEDVNRKQTFPLSPSSSGEGESAPVACNQLKIVFEQSSDFFGRIIVYDLQLEGEEIQS